MPTYEDHRDQELKHLKCNRLLLKGACKKTSDYFVKCVVLESDLILIANLQKKLFAHMRLGVD